MTKTIGHLFVFFSLVLSINCFAQRYPFKEISLQSPTAAALAKYVDVPVNYHTGIPNISVPIYKIQEGSLTLPIELSYHASGIKVSELSSWVGAGWSLQCGGMITRTVRGQPDEILTAAYTTNDKGHLANAGYNQYLFHWVDNSPLADHDAAWFNDFENRESDGEPDLYFFNFNGHSGKFYFHDDGTPMLLPEEDYKIEYNYTAGFGNSISDFTITTPDGTKYYFGKSLHWNQSS